MHDWAAWGREGCHSASEAGGPMGGGVASTVLLEACLSVESRAAARANAASSH